MSTFKLGDTVRWTSQAGGSTKDKTGEIVAIVQPGDRPSPERFAEMHTGAGVGWGRKVTSYVVMVGNKPYWPRTSALRPAEGQDELSRLREDVARLVGELKGRVEEAADLKIKESPEDGGILGEWFAYRECVRMLEGLLVAAHPECSGREPSND